MQAIKESTVAVETLEPIHVDLFKDKKLRDDCRRMFERMVTHTISTLIFVQKPEMYIEFPDDLPKKLQYHPPKQSPAAEKPKKKITLEVEAQEFIVDTPVERKRRTRFSGGYNVEQNIKAMLTTPKEEPVKVRKARNASISSAGSSVKQEISETNLKLKISNIGSKPTINKKRKLDYGSSSSESASDSDAETTANIPNYEEKMQSLFNGDKQEQKKISNDPVKKQPEPIVNDRKKVKTLSSSSDSSEEEEVPEPVKPATPKKVRN
jgi:hypothetical protein